MRRPLLAVACAALAAFALAHQSRADTPTNGGGLSKVTHDSTLSGSGTPSNPLGVTGGIIGDITGVVAGAGLTGGGTSGTTTVDVAATAGGGITVAADSIGLLTSCSTGNVLSWGGSSWACANGVVNAISGTTNTTTKFSGTNAVGNGWALDDGTTWGVSGKFTITEATGAIGVAGLATLTGGFTLGADSSAGSHKITSLTNGSSAQDAAAFGQIATAVNAAVSGTTNTVLKLTGTNTAGNSSITDNGTTATVGSVFAVTESTGAAVTGTITTSNASGPSVRDVAASATVPTLVPIKTATNLGVGAASTTALSLIASGAEVARISVGSASVAALAITSAQAAGGNLGAEVLDATSWTSTGWTGSWAGGWVHTTGNTTALSRTMTNTIGQLYQIAYTVTGRTAGSFTVALASSPSFGGITASGTYGPKTAGTNGPLTITPTTDFDGTIVLSVKLISATSGLVALSNAGGAALQIRGNGSGVFVGNTAGQMLTTGISDVAVGDSAANNVTTGNNITAVGEFAANQTTTGSAIVAVGTSALAVNTTGTNNTGVGYGSLVNTVTASNDSALGASSGRFIADGSTANITSGTSTYLGANTKALADGDQNETVVGYNAIGAGSNTATIGNTSVTATILQGNVNVDSATGFLWSSSSTDPTTTKDTGIARNAAGVVEINSGTAGTLRDLTARNTVLSGTLNVGGNTTLGDASTDSTLINGTTTIDSGVLWLDRFADSDTSPTEIDFLGHNGRWALGMDTANVVKSRDFVLAAMGKTYAFNDGASTSGSPTLTSAAEGGFHTTMIGESISGPGIPGGTTVTAVASPNSLTMSANATATASSLHVDVTDPGAAVRDFIFIKHRGARRPAVGIGITSGVPDGTYQLTVEAPPDETMGAINAASTTSTGVRSAGTPYAFEGTSGTVSITNAFTGATGQNTVEQFESGTSMNTAGDGQRILFTRGGTSNYNAWISSTLSVSSPGFVDPRLDFAVQDTGTIGIANAHTHLSVTNAGASVTGALTVSGAGSFGGALNLNSHLIDNVTDPSSAQDAATKHYVDSVAIPAAVTGTTGTLAMFSGANAIGNSVVTQSGGVVSIGGDLIPTANVKLTQATNQYIYSSLATSTGNASINLDAAGTGVVRINSTTGGVGNPGAGTEVYGTLLATGATSVNGNTTLGDASTDTTTVNGATTITGPASSTTTLAVSGGTTLALGVTGNASVSGTGHVGGNFDVATSKLTVDAATGNTAIGGTLGVTGDSSLAGTVHLNGAGLDLPNNSSTIMTKDGGITVTGCGTSPVTHGNRNGGSVTVGSSGTGCVLTWATAFTSSTPSCVVSSRSSSAKAFAYAPVAGSLTLSSATGTVTYDWVCNDHY